MKKNVIITVIITLITVSPVFSQEPDFDIGALQSTMDDFSGKIAKSLPFNSTMGLNWSDAYINNFPHFGLGLSLGFTTMDSDSFEDLIKMFNLSLPSFVSGFGGYPIPGWTAEARLGGFFLPFDIGFKFGYLPIKPSGMELDYFLIGGDIRYAVLEETFILPAISVGVGFNYMSGGFGQTVGQEIRYAYGDGDEYITVGAPKVGIGWSTSSLDFKAQISKSFIIFTPYLGFGASTGWSKAGYGIKATITGTDVEAAKEAFEAAGITDLSEDGFSSETKVHGWGVRIFGGISFDIALIKLDLTCFFNFNNQYGVTLGTRFQF